MSRDAALSAAGIAPESGGSQSTRGQAHTGATDPLCVRQGMTPRAIALYKTHDAGPTSSKLEQAIVVSCLKCARSLVVPLSSGEGWLRRGLNTWRELFGVARNPDALAIQFFRHVLLSGGVPRPRAKFGQPPSNRRRRIISVEAAERRSRMRVTTVLLVLLRWQRYV
jgi:hypothetical protein